MDVVLQALAATFAIMPKLKACNNQTSLPTAAQLLSALRNSDKEASLATKSQFRAELKKWSHDPAHENRTKMARRLDGDEQADAAEFLLFF